MTIRMRTFLVCDAPRCSVETAELQLRMLPRDWLRLHSTEHVSRAAGSLPPAQMLEQMLGGFCLHLCPKHRHVFDGHQPITTGHATRAGCPRYVDVSCECGAQLGRTDSAHADGYRYTNPARMWLEHLPGRLGAHAQSAVEAWAR